MSEIHKLESEILQMEEVLYILDNDLERIQIDNLHTGRMLSVLYQNIAILKSPGITTMLDAYRKAKMELKYLQEKLIQNTKIENEIDRKIKAIEKEVFKKETLKTDLLNKICIDKVLIFRGRE